MIVHELETWPVYLAAVADGTKRFEVHSTKDRTLAVGDVLVLQEWEPNDGTCSGHSVRVMMTHAPLALEGNVTLSIALVRRW